MNEEAIDEVLEVSGSGGGGKGGGGSSRTPQEDPNTLRATNVAHLVDLVGEGPIEGLVNGLQSVFMDETPVENSDGSFNFSGLRAVTRDGYPDQDPIPGLPGVESETAVSTEVRKDTPVVRTLTNAEADAVRIRVQAPRLSYQNKENGDLKGHYVDFAFDIRQEGSTSWALLGQFRISGKTTSPYQRDYRFGLPGSGPSWEIRMRRLSEDDPGSHIQNKTIWASFTSIIEAKLSYPDSALIGIEADAQQFGSSIPSRQYHLRGRILQVPSNYDPATRSYDGLWDGTFKLAWTDNPAWIYYDVAKNSRYGAGQNKVDKWALYQIARYCDELVPDGYGGQEPRFTCNLVLNTRKEAYQALDSLSSIFRGMTYWASSLVMPVADMPKDPVKHFTRANVIGDFEYSGTARKARHSVVMVSWNDPEDFFRQTVEVVEDTEAIALNGWRTKDVTAIGCSSRGQARRLGKWILYTERFETESLTFTAGSDAFDLRPGDVINISDPAVTGERLGGRVLVSGTDQLKLDTIPDDLDSGWKLDVVMPDMSIQTRDVDSFSGDWVTLSSPLSSEPLEGAVWVMHSVDVEPVTFRVLSVTEGDEELTFNVACLRHYPGKYAYVEEDTPLPDRGDSLIPKGPIGAPYGVTAEPYKFITGGSEAQAVAVSWTPSDDPRVLQYDLEARGPSDTDWQEIYSGKSLSADIRDVEAGEWSLRVRGLDGIGRASPWAYLTTNVAGLLEPLMPTSIDMEVGTFTVSLRPKGLVTGTLWEFWRANTALDLSQVESNAVLLATTTDLVDSELNPSTTYYYWVRGVNAYGVSDWYPIQATTKSNPDKILEVITDQVTESHLYQSLNERIDLVDGPETLTNSVAARVAAEAAARADAITQEQNDRAAAIQNEADSRTTADDALANDITNLTAVVDGNTADIANEQQVRADADSALSSDITNLTTRVDDNQATIANEQQVRSDADSALASDIEVLQATSGGHLWSSSFEPTGGDYSKWSASSSSTIATSADAFSGSQSALMTSTATAPASSGSIEGVRAQIPVSTAMAFSGRRVRISAYAKKPSSGAAAEFALAYSTSDVGNSGWHTFTPTTSWAKFDFTYDIPEASAGGTDWIGIWADTAGAGDGVLIDFLTIEKIATEDDVPEITASIANEQQARIDGDDALASDITTLQASVGDNESAIQSEATTRASEDDALASQITTVQTTLDGQISSVEQSLSSDIDTINQTLNAEYTLKLDVDGYVGGMGIANDGTMVDFAIRADRFYVADPTSKTAQLPFVVDNGTVIIPEGHLGPITFGKVVDANGTSVVTVDGKLKAQYIDAGNLSVQEAATFYGDVQSNNYSAGTSGWRLTQAGGFELNSTTSSGSVKQDGNGIRVYDGNGVVRVKIGKL